jgi:nicotinate-nucleotide--dimethylbenzimidazole phosphoribosyltransferase
VDESALPTRSIFDDAPPMDEELDEAASAMAAQVDEAVSPAIPAALSFDAPTQPESSPSAPIPPSVEATGPARLDGPPPRAPLANRPFFLEDAEPPRAFGRDDRSSDAPPIPVPSTPAPARLFGGPTPSAPAIPPEAPGKLPGRSTAANGAPPAPLTARRPNGSDVSPPVAPEPLPTDDAVADAPVAEAPAVDAPVAEAPVAEAPVAEAPVAEAPAAEAVTTSSGLAKRVPRAAGATRAIPGSETERGVAATRRSPEEIRKMLAQHSAGRQRARVQESVPAGAPDERETHE